MTKNMKRLLIYTLGKNEARAFMRLSLKHKFYCAYFCLSLCALCIGDESPLWAILLVVLNFVNSVRLIKKVPLKIEEV
jgi:1,4-dihydroxy-2-naphthoate octaprenyltransferase